MEQYKDPGELRNAIMMTLMKGPTYVLFRKKDGTIRAMVCTLHNQLIPQNTSLDPTASKTYKQRSDKSIAVYDLEKREWRAFVLDNLLFFQELNKVSESQKASLKEKYNG